MVNAGKMEDIQIINDRQVKTTHAYKNTKQKLLKTKAAIWLKNKIVYQTIRLQNTLISPLVVRKL
jgi:hypothetical protein